ncbi:MAG: hypothetical protein O3B47_04670, partial [bacterium]|nr:hypothetical protein [bacterium]
ERSGGKASSGLKKVDEAAKEGKTEQLDIEETMAVAATGLMTLTKLRKKYPKKADFQKALERIAKLSKKSKYPIQKLFGEDVLKIFKIKDTDEGLKFLGRFGIKASMGDAAAKLAGAFGVETEGGEASHAKEMLTSLSHSPMKNTDEVVTFMRKYFFPNTGKGNVLKTVKTINTLIVKKKTKIDPKTLTDLVFNIDNDDYKHLIAALVGKPSTKVEEVA